MITATVGDLLDGGLDSVDTDRLRLYVVRDGTTVFYVGQSKDVIARLLGHLGRGDWVFYGKSTLGKTIEVNLPQSLIWQIDLLPPTDCGADDVDTAEQNLIDRYIPYLNIKGKHERSGPLPKRYKTPWAQVANEGVKLT